MLFDFVTYSSNKIFLACGSGIKPFLEYLFVGSAEAIFSNFLLIPFIFLKFFADNSGNKILLE